MCGITGFNWNDKKLIKKISDLIYYRGPDGFGYYTDHWISLGQRRLKIVDLTDNGKQPMFSENKKVVVVFNGEIWNYKELRENLLKKQHKFKSNSDTEVIVHGYEEYGTEIFSMLDGMFAIALYDKKYNKIFLARDKVGKRPLYYYHKKDKIIFSSEIKSILATGLVKKEINEQCLSDYLSLRYSAGQETMIKDIFKVAPGSYIEYSKGKIKMNKYWNLPGFEPKRTPDEKEIDKLIEKSVQKRLIGDVPIGILLSGGLDSSAIVSYFSRLGYKPHTFSLGFGDNTDETKYAEIVSKKFNTEHTTIKMDNEILSYLPQIIWHSDEPLADPAILPTYVLCKEVSKKVKVAFSGEGGDEVFGGYADFNFLYTLKKINNIPYIIRKPLGMIAGKVSKLFEYPLKQKIKLMSEILENEDVFASSHKKLFYLPFDEIEKKNLLNQEIIDRINLQDPIDKYLNYPDNPWDNAVRYYFGEWLPNDLLMKADKAGLAHGLELRNPFLDYSLIDYFFHIENKYKKDRMIFRKVVSSMLPDEIMKKKKQGFVLPISRWFMDEKVLLKIKPHFDDLMNRKIFKKEEVSKIFNNPKEFRNDHKIWVLLNFEIWAKLYLDNKKIEEIKI